jgi:hypothetical protein
LAVYILQSLLENVYTIISAEKLIIATRFGLFRAGFCFNNDRCIIGNGFYKLINIIMDEQNQNIPAENSSSGSNKKIYILAAVIVVILLGFYIFSSNKSIAPGVEVDEKINGDVTITTEDGTVIVGGNSLPADWPNDVPSYSNASIQYSGQIDLEDGEKGLSLAFTTKDSVQAVSNFYNSELSKNGWTVSQVASMGDAAVVSGNKDTRNVGIYIGKSEDGQTAVTIGISTN